MIKKIKQHLQDANKTYFEHQRFAFRASIICIKSSFTAFVHGICQAFFEYDTSSNIKKMYQDMEPIYKFLEERNKK